MFEDYDILIKVTVVGDTCVGKSSLSQRLSDRDKGFSNIYNATICMDFLTTIVNYNNKKIKLQMWDTAGQERFRSISQSYFRTGEVTILCFSHSDRKSFTELNNWKRQVHDRNPDTKFILVGTKCDLSSEISDSEIQTWSIDNDIPYIRTSALKNIGCDKVIDNICIRAKGTLRHIPYVEPVLESKSNANSNSNSNFKFKFKCCTIL